MPEDNSSKTATARKAEGPLDPAKQGQEAAADTAQSDDVEAHGASVRVICPGCHTVRFVYLEVEGEWFTCSNCGTNYQVYL
ncbi:MAG: hypothetical protein JO069_15315 [Verrucomicrobia bacterium]|nr:hypothetical protein [Verrucomicrobiota bacterium]